MRLEDKVALISGAAYIKVSPHKIRSWDYSQDAG